MILLPTRCLDMSSSMSIYTKSRPLHIEAALKIDPSHADTHAMRTDLLVMEGNSANAIESIASALRLTHGPPLGTIG